MSETGPSPQERWAFAVEAAAIVAVDPVAVGGALVRARTGPVRDAWLALVQKATGPFGPIARMPVSITDDRLIGGLDLAATLAAGRPVARRGLLAESDGGIVLVPTAERLEATTASRLAMALDHGEIVVERDGFSTRNPAHIGIIALDEGSDDDASVPTALRERLAIAIDLEGLSVRVITTAPGLPEVAEARERLSGVGISKDAITTLVEVAEALGIDGVRAPLLAVAVARASAALAGRRTVSEKDCATAARLVLGPRATRLPQPPPESDEPPPPPPSEGESQGTTAEQNDPKPLDDIVLDAAKAALPAQLLAGLAQAAGQRARQSGKAGASILSGLRGRPIGARRGEPQRGQRLAVLDTLRAAAPWQRIRRQLGATPGRIAVRREDFHVRRYREHSETVTVFAVDASGSAALHRLAEAKGAVELLLAECYVRRDKVALIAFRGTGADLILPPTRSLVRAKRALAGLPGGGGTPLATAIDTLGQAAREVTRRGARAVAVLMTDGRANIARNGAADRTQAAADALQSARLFAATGVTTLFVDTSPRPQPVARELAGAMGATYLPLPDPRSGSLSAAIQAVG